MGSPLPVLVGTASCFRDTRDKYRTRKKENVDNLETSVVLLRNRLTGKNCVLINVKDFESREVLLMIDSIILKIVKAVLLHLLFSKLIRLFF
jgi:hypothetical protein